MTLSPLVSSAMLQSFRKPILRPSSRALPSLFRRALHRKTAHFVTRNDQDGSEASRIIEIFIGDAHESYVLIDRRVGDELRAAANAAGAETLPLTFHHTSRHFDSDGADKFEYPRLELPQPLPVPRHCSGEKSAATLWASPVSDCIALNGTADNGFAKLMNDTEKRLGPVIEQLKDC
ncbi:uncharacterized protein BKA78DRAFT_355158 [Phyllosticta capitalensis]|uniref:uncharacterized protein n=1 Tax=Phyllosticta capitalensis TaxID=121624 RepID=UPI0031326E3F